MSITRYGPFPIGEAQYTLDKNRYGTWDLTDITGTVVATFTHTRGMGPRGPFWAWACDGHRLALDPRGAVNTWAAAQGGTVAA